jgi:hypothetical protein
MFKLFIVWSDRSWSPVYRGSGCGYGNEDGREELLGRCLPSAVPNQALLY